MNIQDRAIGILDERIEKLERKIVELEKLLFQVASTERRV